MLNKQFFTDMFGSNSTLDEEEIRKRIFFTIGISIGTVLLFTWGIVDYYNSNIFMAVLDFFIAAVLLSSFFLQKKIRQITTIFRINLFFLSIILLIYVWTGSTQGLDLHYLYVYPIILFIALGHEEGAKWIVGFLAIILFLFFFPAVFDTHRYEPSLSARFLSSFILISMFAYIVERLRKTFYVRLQEKNDELETSLAEIKTLSGLLPICSSCKKIRDDKGYWGQLESYITKHSEAQFSHGICPECYAKLKIELSSVKQQSSG